MHFCLTKCSEDKRNKISPLPLEVVVLFQLFFGADTTELITKGMQHASLLQCYSGVARDSPA